MVAQERVARGAKAGRRALLRVRDVTKVYAGGTRANDGITIDVQAGEVFGLLGPNGAGKTTLVSQIVGLLRPTSGSMHIGDIDLVADPDAARQLSAYLPQSQLPIESLRVQEAVRLSGRVRGGEARSIRERGDALIARLQLDEWRNVMGHSLSGGVRRLTGFVMTAVVPRPLVILDEPTNDVDPLRRRLLWREIRALADAGSAVLLVTHNVMEAERVVDRLAIVDRGRVVAQGTPASLKTGERGQLRMEIILEPDVTLSDLPGYIRDPIQIRRRLLATLDEGRAAEAIEWLGVLVRAGLAEEYELGATSLEDTYVRLVDAGEGEGPVDSAGPVGEEGGDVERNG